MQNNNLDLLNVLTREGVLISVSIRYWRGCKKLKAEDLGLDPDNVVTRPAGDSTVSAYVNGRLSTITERAADGSQVSQVSIEYDAHGRPFRRIDARNGTTEYSFNNADEIVSVTTPPPATGQPALVTTRFYDSMGRIVKEVHPDNTATTNEYYVTGNLKKSYGSRTIPVGYGYDAQGRMTRMTNWTSFGSGSGERTTTWTYNPQSGLLQSKRDASGYGADYTYTTAGRLQTRVWARGNPRVTTTYSYDNGGRLSSVSYNDGVTPSVTYTYDRPQRVFRTDRNGVTAFFDYAADGRRISERISGGVLNGRIVSYGYDAYARRTSVSVNTSPVLTFSYGYNGASRLASVSEGGHTSTYSYVGNSTLVQQLNHQQGTVARLTTTMAYDDLNRMTSVSGTPFGSPVVSFGYQYNSAGQRTQMSLSDGSRWRFGYDSLGQVVSGKRYWSDDVAVAGQQYEYGFDEVGNRTVAKTGGTQNGDGLRSADYVVNSINQHTSRAVPGVIDILGSAAPSATVSVNGSQAYRRGDYFHFAMPVSNGGAVYAQVTVTSGTNSVTRNAFISGSPESFSYDLDGNITSDGKWLYTWDAENRLIKMESHGSAPSASRRRVEFEYDYMGRRVVRRVTNLYTGTTSETRFVYDDWNVLAELDGANVVMRSYMWGLDLSGTTQSAGGVGGLLKVRNHLTPVKHHFVMNDGNGNVTALVDADTGSFSARYEYGPFGEPIRVTGTMGNANPLRWSTKYTDDETDLIYYGYRYYNPSTGRWLSRDPIEEKGGPNLYAFTKNNPVNAVDPLGQNVYKVIVPFIPPIEHRMIIGDDGEGGVYVIDFGPNATSLCDCRRIISTGVIRYDHLPKQSAEDYIRGFKSSQMLLEDWQLTSAEVDKQMASEAIELKNGKAPLYIVGVNDCNVWADKFLLRAKALQKQQPIKIP